MENKQSFEELKNEILEKAKQHRKELKNDKN